jgi:hypothetical protein
LTCTDDSKIDWQLPIIPDQILCLVANTINTYEDGILDNIIVNGSNGINVSQEMVGLVLCYFDCIEKRDVANGIVYTEPNSNTSKQFGIVSYGTNIDPSTVLKSVKEDIAAWNFVCNLVIITTDGELTVDGVTLL